MSILQAGTGRTCITPFWGVELTGWGYYLKRTWRDVHDDLNATALVVSNDETTLVIISLDLMVIDENFTADVRQQVKDATSVPLQNILVCCTHTHSAPSAGGLLGVGEVDPLYESWAAKQSATAAIVAWSNQQPAQLAVSTSKLDNITFNRTRDAGPVDPNLTTLWVNDANDKPIGVVVNFQGHPTVSTVLQPWSVSRDLPGEVCDQIEATFPGCLTMYLQGACGDVNFHREYATPERCHEPATIISERVIASKPNSPMISQRLQAESRVIQLPTRRWTRDEIDQDRVEAQQRLDNHDINGWRDSIGRVMTNRPDDMIARHGGDEWKAVAAMCRFNMEWTIRILRDWETRDEWHETEIQALRIGNLGIVSNSSEFFTTLALEIREHARTPHLMLACYANGRIGYLPDAHDVERKTYAAYQSPKYCNQFPFTEESGPVMVQESTSLMNELTG